MGKSRRIKITLEPPKTITETETQKLLRQLRIYQGTGLQQRRGIRNEMIALVMLETGLRVAEVTNLVIGDLWYVTAPVENLIVRSEIAKRNKERTVPISTKLHKAIANMQEIIWTPDSATERAYAFYMKDPMIKLTTRSIERVIKSAAAKAFRKTVTPHTLRHTFATRILVKSNTSVVQALLGHKCLSSTQRYLHPSADSLKAAIFAAE